VALVATAAALTAGVAGVYRYLDNFWLYRGYPPPRDPAWVKKRGTVQTIAVSSPAIGGRRQQVIVFLPPGYAAHPRRRYSVFYLLHGSPGLPNALLLTVKAGVVEDELLAKHKIRPLILVMPFGSSGRFTDTEWANGVHANSGWETFLARDIVRAIDNRYRTIRSGAGRALGGLSEGGYGSLNVGLHHPGEFRVLESWSGYERRQDPLDFRPCQAATRIQQPPRLPPGRRSPAPPRTDLCLVLLEPRRPLSRTEQSLCARARAAAHSPQLRCRFGRTQLACLARELPPGDSRRLEGIDWWLEHFVSQG